MIQSHLDMSLHNNRNLSYSEDIHVIASSGSITLLTKITHFPDPVHSIVRTYQISAPEQIPLDLNSSILGNLPTRSPRCRQLNITAYHGFMMHDDESLLKMLNQYDTSHSSTCVQNFHMGKLHQ